MPGVKFVAAKRDFKAAHAAHVSKSFTSLKLKQNHRKQIVAIQVAIAILQLSSLEVLNLTCLRVEDQPACLFQPHISQDQRC